MPIHGPNGTWETFTISTSSTATATLYPLPLYMSPRADMRPPWPARRPTPAPTAREIVNAWDAVMRALEKGGPMEVPVFYARELLPNGTEGRLYRVRVNGHGTDRAAYEAARSELIRERIAADKERERNRVVCDHHPLDSWCDE